mgnify:CR=1 FL=1|jgi:Fe-S-cluster-containing dehydrogenase component
MMKLRILLISGNRVGPKQKTGMGKRILLDMISLRAVMSRNPDVALPEGFFKDKDTKGVLKPLRELAVFRFACRRCEDAPCIAVCPADAIDKDSEGIIDRHLNLCVACKSCVTACPFGTMMTDFFRYHRNKDLFYDLNDENERELFVRACPDGVASFTEMDEKPEENIYRLNDRILIRDYMYFAEQKQP